MEMNKMILRLLLTGLVAGLLFVACGGGSEPLPTRDLTHLQNDQPACSLATYREQSEGVMDEVGQLARTTDLDDADDVTATISRLAALETQAKGLRCAANFPLKQETLVFTITHFRDSLRAVENGDLAAADRAMTNMELNMTRFADWTVDVD